MQLHRCDYQAFKALRASCRACKFATDYLFYRKINIISCNDIHWVQRRYKDPNTYELDSRCIKPNRCVLRDYPNGAAQYIQDLSVGPVSKPEDLDPDEIFKSVEGLLKKCINLRDFRYVQAKTAILSSVCADTAHRWTLCYDIPLGVLNVLRTKLPQCRLHVTYQSTPNDCPEIGLHRPSREASLTLTLLLRVHELRCSGSTDLDTLLPRQQIVQDPPISVASPVSMDSAQEQTIVSYRPAGLETPFGNRLESIYVGEADSWVSCARLWTFNIDWTSLASLNIRFAEHRAVLTFLVGRTPNLKALEICSLYRKYAPYTGPASLRSYCDDVLRSFLLSTPKLETLNIMSHNPAKWPHTRDTILDCSGLTLRRLTIVNSEQAQERYYWDADDMEHLVCKAPHLRSLAVELDAQHKMVDDYLRHDCSLVSSRQPLIERYRI